VTLALFINVLIIIIIIIITNGYYRPLTENDVWPTEVSRRQSP